MRTSNIQQPTQQRRQQKQKQQQKQQQQQRRTQWATEPPSLIQWQMSIPGRRTVATTQHNTHVLGYVHGGGAAKINADQNCKQIMGGCRQCCRSCIARCKA
jgi:acetyl esterase/lipase